MSEDVSDLDGEAAQPRRSRLRRLAKRIAHGWRWLRNPDAVGQPLVLRPRALRLLIILVVGNVAALAILTIALYRAPSLQAYPESPLPVVVIEERHSSPPPALTPTPFGNGGAIAFTLRRDGNTDIYAINQFDRQLVRLTDDPAEDRQPSWSPDGNYLAFASNRASNWDIYLMDLVSGALIRLTHDQGFDANPSWSPDGQWIAFESYRRDNLDIYIMTPSGDQVRRITTDPAPDYSPAWSPDGKAIAFASFRDGNRDIYIYTLDDGKLVNLTQTSDLDEDVPAWSPDGARLAYVSGPRGNPSVQVAVFNWDTVSVDEEHSELFGSGRSPAWAPDGQTLIYTYERGQQNYLVAASITSWALFQEVYGIDARLDDLAWTDLALNSRVIARAQPREASAPTSFYVELIQSTPTSGPPYRLVALPGLSDGAEEYLSDRVNESFNALRGRVLQETGWDYLGGLSSAWRPITYTPSSGQTRTNWQLCGRGVSLDQGPYESDDPKVELIREDLGAVTYWRVFVRAGKQDGSIGEPLREVPWDLNARDEGGDAMIEGGAYRAEIPPGYYVDLTTLASDYGWERLPSLWRWRYFWPDIRWWEFQNTGGLSWWECMLDLHDVRDIERQFGPIPGHEE
ncbi:MAG: hypothetical protein GX620_14560 [Chloroflexi bacterium]|nr:hypothetical protein [Chloroflexota bacterium]